MLREHRGRRDAQPLVGRGDRRVREEREVLERGPGVDEPIDVEVVRRVDDAGDHGDAIAVRGQRSNRGGLVVAERRVFDSGLDRNRIEDARTSLGASRELFEETSLNRQQRSAQGRS